MLICSPSPSRLVANLTWAATCRFLGILGDTLYPPICPTCQASVDAPGRFCSPCLADLPRLGPEVCPFCERPASHGMACPRRPVGLRDLVAASAYRGPIRRLVRGLKYRRDVRLVRPLGELLVGALCRSGWAGRADAVAWVPLHPMRRLVRGFNQAELLARYVAERLRLPTSDRLRRVRNTRPLFAATRAERRELLEDAFELKPGPRLDCVLIVDDVYTTGVTMGSCAGLFADDGAHEVVGAVCSR